jgi:preprotein translocase subunit Sec61beta
MASNKVSMPQSGGGLITYYDEFKSKIVLDKKWIIVAIVIVAIIEIFLNRAF